MSAEQQILRIIQHKLQHDQLVLPTLPEIALQVRQRSSDPNVSLQQMADIISQDPALAVRIVKLSNSAFIGRSIRVNTLNQAVTRIGLSQIRNVAIAMALEQVFISSDKAVQQQLSRLWQSSVQITSIAVACLAFYNARHPKSRLSLDVMTLASLVHNIGALPLLSETEKHKAELGEPRFLQHISDKLAPEITKRILTSWQFAPELQYAAEHWRELKPERDEPGYADFLRLALIAKDHFTDKELQQRLLQYYVTQQLVPDNHFMQSPEITAVYQDVRSIFN